jgi:[ribosomal protein S18]-alanine N-acetyltransferase
MIREIEYLSDANPFAKYIEYIIDGKKVGYLKYSHIYDRIEIDDLFVSIDNRNQGIGNKLMSYIVWKAIDTHSVNITLEVRVSNTIARNLYKKYGFREVALRKSYYGDEDGILMEKQVM